MEQLDLALLILRLALGVTIAAHGINKIKGGLAGTGQWFESMGMRPGRIHGPLAAITEIGAGAMIATGLLLPLACAAVLSLMVVAIWVAHRKNGFFIFNKDGGWEYCAFLAAAAVSLGILGAGRWSLDCWFDIHITGWNRSLITVGVGLVSAGALLAACYRTPPAKPT